MSKANTLNQLRYKQSFSLILLSLLFCVCFYDIIAKAGMTFTDELLVLYLYSCWLYMGVKNSEFVFFIYISLFYLLYGIIQRTNVLPAILTDFFIEIKPFMAFYTAYLLKIHLIEKEKQIIRNVCVLFSIAFLPIGMNYVLGGDWVYIIPGHPSRYATIYQILGLVYLSFSKRNKRNYKEAAFIIFCSVLSMRSKAYGFFAFYMAMVIFENRMLRNKIITFKNIGIAVIILSVTLFVARDKILFFFVDGTTNSEDMYARPALYVKGIEIMKDYPVWGSGLGSYATYASGVYYSPLYYRYNLDTIYGLEPDNCLFISDTFYPVFAQFGVLGFVLFVVFWKRRMMMANSFRKKGDKNSFLISLSIMMIIIIDSVADSTFIQNRGVFLMMIMGIVLSESRRNLRNI